MSRYAQQVYQVYVCKRLVLPCGVGCAALCRMGEASRLCATQHSAPTCLANVVVGTHKIAVIMHRQLCKAPVE